MTFDQYTALMATRPSVKPYTATEWEQMSGQHKQLLALHLPPRVGGALMPAALNPLAVGYVQTFGIQTALRNVTLNNADAKRRADAALAARRGDYLTAFSIMAAASSWAADVAAAVAAALDGSAGPQ